MIKSLFARVSSAPILKGALACALACALFALPACSAPAENQSDTTTANESAADLMTVSVTVSSDAADGSVSYSEDVQLEEGATAYDALMATGLDVTASDSSYGKYIEAVGGLGAGDFGDMSGWLYAVNGEDGAVACDQCVLATGDSVEWYYTV